MRGFYFKSISGNIYFYNDETGFIELRRELNEVPSVKVNREVSSNNKSTPEITVENVQDYLFNGAGFKQLILELSAACNLRCRYCVYGEHYEHYREHDNQLMSFEMAKENIDFYMKHFQKQADRHFNQQPIIGFFGGEPLLNFHVLKKCVAYIKATYDAFTPRYSITTNGLLLRDEIADFLINNEFSIVVSLDGDKENHDRNRVKSDLSGSFDEIYSNLMWISEKYPSYKFISLSVCFDYKTNLVQISKFLDKENFMIANFALVNNVDTDYFKQFTLEDNENFIKSYNQLYDQFQVRLSHIETEGISITNFSNFLFYYLFVSYMLHPINDATIQPLIPHTATCIPADKIFIDVHQNIHMCERITCHFSIGNVKTGMDYEKICDMINNYNKQLTACASCPTSRLCDLCFMRVTQGDKLLIQPELCQSVVSSAMSTVENFVNLMEQYPTQFEKLLRSNSSFDFYTNKC